MQRSGEMARNMLPTSDLVTCSFVRSDGVEVSSVVNFKKKEEDIQVVQVF